MSNRTEFEPLAAAVEEYFATYDDAWSQATKTKYHAELRDLQRWLVEETNTSSGKGVDPYLAGLLSATDAEMNDEVAEQNRQVDVAAAAGESQQQAVLALSIVALAGVLAGVAAVLGSGKAGWLVLLTGWAAAGVATVLAVRVLF